MQMRFVGGMTCSYIIRKLLKGALRGALFLLRTRCVSSCKPESSAALLLPPCTKALHVSQSQVTHMTTRTAPAIAHSVVFSTRCQQFEVSGHLSAGLDISECVQCTSEGCWKHAEASGVAWCGQRCEISVLQCVQLTHKSN